MAYESNMMFHARGPAAHSHFRLERLLAKISHRVPQVVDIEAVFVHFIQCSEPLTKEKQRILNAFLEYGTAAEPPQDAEKQLQYLVVPRQPLTRAWSLQATEALHQAGLGEVLWIERGTLYVLHTEAPLTEQEARVIAESLREHPAEQVLYGERLSFKEDIFAQADRGLELAPAHAIHATQNPTLKLKTESIVWEAKENPASKAAVLGFLCPTFSAPAKESKRGRREPIQSLEWYARLSAMNAAYRHYNALGYPTVLGFFRSGVEFGGTPTPTTTKLPAAVAKTSVWDRSLLNIQEATESVLRLPGVSDKTFLVTTADRSAGGLVARDAMVGPWQVPVADCVVMADDFTGDTGVALALGEQAPLKALEPKAGVRMAVGEAITNLAAAGVGDWSQVRVAESAPPAAKRYCQALGIAVAEVRANASPPVPDESESVLLVAPVADVHKTLTPCLDDRFEDTELLFIDLSLGQARMAGSRLAEVYKKKGEEIPDGANDDVLKQFFNLIQNLNAEQRILAYHDRSDGGLLITLCEMAFASHLGLHIEISACLQHDAASTLFNEELGAVIQVKTSAVWEIVDRFKQAGIESCYPIGKPMQGDRLEVYLEEEVVVSASCSAWHKIWSETGYYLQRLRDNPRYLKKQWDVSVDSADPGLIVEATFDWESATASGTTPAVRIGGAKPKVAILREQGVTAHHEMTAAFDAAGFDCIDVHTNDLETGRVSLSVFKGLAVCGGFSFGDVFGAGNAWAKKILFNDRLAEQFSHFFERNDTFSLGISNGCQMLSALRTLIPGVELWPQFLLNASEQFECRLVQVEVQTSPSIFLQGMEGSQLPIVVAHNEGRAVYEDEEMLEQALKKRAVVMRFVDSRGRKTSVYPANPNGSDRGITGLTTQDGRVTILMTHPERLIRTFQYSWHPREWGKYGPWIQFFRNARQWVKG